MTNRLIIFAGMLAAVLALACGAGRPGQAQAPSSSGAGSAPQAPSGAGSTQVPSGAGNGGSGGQAAQQQPGQPPHAAEQAAQAGALPFTYRPSPRGAPGYRTGGSTRGGPGGDLSITVLAPSHVGHTTEAQPTLYWFASRAISDPIEVIVTAEDAVNPLLDVRLKRGATAGINRLSLADFGVRLEPEKDYSWSVVVVANPDQPSRNLVTTGGIRRVALPAGLAAQVNAVPPERRASLYAENGLWYDALATLSRLAAARPDQATWRQQRAMLLRQGELPEIAALESRN